MMIRSTDDLVAYSLRLSVETPLSVGAGNLGFMKEVLKAPAFVGGSQVLVPVIPSSSIKGALRAVAESLRGSLGDSVLERVAKGHSRIDEFKRMRDVAHEFDGDLEEIKRLTGESLDVTDERKREELLRRACPICRLFGAPGIASRMRLSDAVPAGAVHLGYMTRVAMDRKRMKVKEKRIFRDEFVLPGAEFRALMILDFRGCSAALVNGMNAVLDRILRFGEEVGLQLGGGRSIGRGLVKLSVTEIKGADS